MSGRPDLDPLFAPDSVAVVGASPDSYYAANLIDNLLDFGFDGDLYLVNPGREEAWGRPCYDDVGDVPAVVDLAVVSVPREYVVDVVASAGERGVPAAMVITAGFSVVSKFRQFLFANLLDIFSHWVSVRTALPYVFCIVRTILPQDRT
jgi:acetyltransferase